MNVFDDDGLLTIVTKDETFYVTGTSYDFSSVRVQDMNLRFIPITAVQQVNSLPGGPSSGRS
ncbi:hypothetical protein QJS10_CPB13g00593 [Acorus calamus]|uniref:Uncharacterized protein n=1 Tax=Acorus calamus TaxID=4465 RepID=A0AAV9DDL7_ACOCL|nr:hypothetical protein QJS10_CPB13g00593 [Acorus calamus]